MFQYIKPLLAVLLCTLTACSATKTNIPVGQLPPAVPPTEGEVSEARSLAFQYASQQGHSTRQSGASYLRAKRIIDRLVKASGFPSNPYPIYIVDAGEEVNAAAVKNATILVYEELLRRVPEDDELATVLSHEMAHIFARHGSDTTSQQRGAFVSLGSSLLGAAAAIGASYAGVGGAADLIGSATETATGVIGQGAIVLSYDRKLEYEADHVGLMIMAKAGYDPRRALGFWAKSDQILGGGGGFSFLSTHPANADRLVQLQKALPFAMTFFEESKAASMSSAIKSRQPQRMKEY